VAPTGRGRLARALAVFLAATASGTVFTVTTGCEGFVEAPPQPVALRDDLELQRFEAEAQDGRTPELGFLVAPGVVSLQIEARAPGASFEIASLRDAHGGDALATLTTRSAGGVPGEIAWLYPNEGRLPGVGAELSAGAWTLSLRVRDAAGGAFHGPIDVRVLGKRPVPGDRLCGVHLDVIVADDALHADDLDGALAALTAHLNPLLEPAGVTIVDYGVARLAGVDSRVEIGGDLRRLVAVVDRAMAALDHQGLARAGALRVVVVRSLGLGGASGYALELPASYPLGGERATSAAVLLATEGLLDADGYFDAARASVTLTHELGHGLGLYHTTEQSGAPSDPLADTPECAQPPCGDDFSTNVMTPGGSPARHVFTPSQSAVMRRHPTCVPTDRPWRTP
jgi:hypothetical protein